MIHQMLGNQVSSQGDSAVSQAATEQGLASELYDLKLRWNSVATEGLQLQDKSLNRIVGFRMRGIACSLARIQTQAVTSELPTYIPSQVKTLRYKMASARYTAEDYCQVLPFDPKFWTSETQSLTEEEWDELSRCYEGAAEADEVLDWYVKESEALSTRTRVALLNAIGAKQQMLFRALTKHNADDMLLKYLFYDFRDATASAGYLSSQDEFATWEELIAIGGDLQNRYAEAQSEVKARSAIKELLEWVNDYLCLSCLGYSAAEIQDQLGPLLDACSVAGVPPTNTQVLEALLQVDSDVLYGLAKRSTYVRGALQQLQRRDRLSNVIALPEEVSFTNVDMGKYTAEVSKVAKGKRILVLGGTAKAKLETTLKKMLDCAEVDWVSSHKRRHIGDFETEICRTDIVIVIEKIANHSMTLGGGDLAKKHGKLYVLIPGGFGVNAIIRQMYLQLVHDPSVQKQDDLALKSGMTKNTAIGTSSFRAASDTRGKQQARSHRR